MSKPDIDFTLVKPAHQKTTYTPHQIREIKKCMSDPLYFMQKYMWIQHPTQGKIPFEAYEYQKNLIECYWKYKEVIALLPRQSGKTTTAAGYLLWYTMFNDDVTVLIAANKFRAATEIMDRIKFAYEELPNWLRAGSATYNVQDIKFDNGSRIKATTTTPDSGRGMSISLLYLDEFAFVKPRIAEEFWTAMSPTLATGGKCIITSTPNSDEDKFAEIWAGANKTQDDYGNDIPNGLGVNGFKAFTSHYSDVPGRDEQWAAKERNKIGADKFDREYGCQFLTADETLINAVTLLKLQGTDPLYKVNEIRWYDNLKPNNTYLVALDPSAGVGKDPAAIEVFSLPEMKQIAEWTHNRTSIPNQVKIMQNITNLIASELKKMPEQRGEPDIFFTLENNSWGEAALLTISEIGEERFGGTMLHEARVRGMGRPRRGLNTNQRSKALACSKLKSLIESEKLKVASRPLVRQLKFFVSKGESFAAKQGENDDCVMATLLCVRMMFMIQNWDEKVGDLLREDFGDDYDYEEPMPISVIIN